MGLLKLFGAQNKLPNYPKPRLESEIPKPEPEDGKRSIGHTILVDGHMVRGMIGSRPN